MRLIICKLVEGEEVEMSRRLMKGRYTFDLHDSVPNRNMSDKERKEYWDDGIHWTPKGYDLVGSRIAERLIEILKSEESDQGSEHGELKRKNA